MPLETIPALFLDAVETYDKQDAFIQQEHGEFFHVSHRELRSRVTQATCGLLAMGLSKGDRIAILSENRVEWVVADLATLCAGCVTVPVYPTLPANQVEYVLRDAEARAVFVSGRAQLDKISSIRLRLPSVQHVFSFDSLEAEAGAVDLRELMRRGSTSDPGVFDTRIATIGSDDWASIIYTSGTTGDPKGAVLSHENFVSNVTACTKVFPIGPEDRCLSCLPLSHAFERTAGYYAPLHKGITVVYPETGVKFADSLRDVQPTFMVTVPRFLEKLHDSIHKRASAGPAVAKSLFLWAKRVAVAESESTAGRRTLKARLERSAAEILVYRKIKRRLGGRLHFVVSGGAALRSDITEFFHGMGLPVLEGYGLTETSPVVSVNTLHHFKPGTVGKPVPGVEVKIAEDGEILVKGPNVMQGYFKQPGHTRDVLSGRWLRTGDIGHLDDEGFLVITDRKKGIIVTAGGKNVAPHPIEDLLERSDYISQVLLVGNNRRFISAIIVPDFDKLEEFARQAGISFTSHADLLEHPDVVGKIRDEIERQSEPLAGFERVKKFILAAREFSIELNEITPTLKLRRRVIERKFEKEIDALYAE